MFRVLFAAIALFVGVNSTPAQAQGKMLQACADLGELARGLDQVVNEMQIYNYSNDIWEDSRGCEFRFIREMIPGSSYFVGWYLTVPPPGEPRFWTLIYQVDFRPRRPGLRLAPSVTLREETRLFVSYRIYRAQLLAMPSICRRRFSVVPTRYGPIKLNGVDRAGVIPACDFAP